MDFDNNDIADLASSAWREKVYIETAEYIIIGYVFMPKIGKRSRLLSEILNTQKHFLAIKDYSIEFKNRPQREIEHHDFMQLNISTILLMRPLEDD